MRTEVRSCPSKEASRSWSKTSPLMRMWYTSLDTSALFGMHHLGRGMINARECRAHLVAGTNRLPGAGVDLLTRAKKRFPTQWCPSLEDRGCVVNVRGVPAQKLVRTLRWVKELGRALDIAVCSAASGWPRRWPGRHPGHGATHRKPVV